jgi:hypothetical protein
MAAIQKPKLCSTTVLPQAAITIQTKALTTARVVATPMAWAVWPV